MGGDRSILKRDSEGELYMNAESMMLLTELTGLETAGPADGKLFSYGSRAK